MYCLSLLTPRIAPLTLRRRWRFIWRYLRGDAPWDSGIVPPEITAWIAAHDSAGNPPGRALDLGCGTGTTSLFLARHGWTVTGLDFAPNVIRRARREARRQGVTERAAFLSADVSRPDLLADAPPYDLLIDVGCLHTLDPDTRTRYAANVTRLARPGAALLLYAFAPGPSHDGRRRTGVDPAGLRDLLSPAFEIVTYTPGEEATTPRPSAWYTLRRTDSAL